MIDWPTAVFLAWLLFMAAVLGGWISSMTD